ncbi:DUF6291 domain-containing protein [Capnocytophaga gingivalis]|uniref:DUF6291 domain-containing protein n=1 Tax=Capnocytophaga gingivalis TaxID=1017 RepID=UPI003C77BED0
MERESFVFYSSFLKAIRAIKKRDIQAELALAIIEYGITGETTECGEVVSVAMELIKPQIEANNKKYINGMKGAEYSVNGGRPKKAKPKENPKQTPKNPQEDPSLTPNVNDNDNVNDNISFLEKKKQKSDVIVSDLENENSESPIETLQTPKEQSGGGRKKFTIPTPEEVQAYCDERKNGILGQQFCDFYSSKGWKIGKEPMKDWKAAVRTWEMRRKDSTPSVAQPQPQNSPPKRIRFDEYGNEVIY